MGTCMIEANSTEQINDICELSVLTSSLIHVHVETYLVVIFVMCTRLSAFLIKV